MAPEITGVTVYARLVYQWDKIANLKCQSGVDFLGLLRGQSLGLRALSTLTLLRRVPRYVLDWAISLIGDRFTRGRSSIRLIYNKQLDLYINVVLHQ